MHFWRIFRKALWLASPVLSAAAYGQGVPVLKQGNIELGGFGIFSFGTATPAGSQLVVAAGASNNLSNVAPLFTPQSNGGFGAHIGFALSRHVVQWGEWSYLAGGKVSYNQNYNQNTGAGATLFGIGADIRSSGQLMEGGLEFRMPLARAPKLVPYITGGGGVLRTSFNFNSSAVGFVNGYTNSGNSIQYSTLGSGGAGVRFYFTEHAGLRLEAKGYAGQDSTRFGRIVVGLFYQR